MQSIQVPIAWKQSEGINVDANIEVVPVVSKQSLKCMKYYTPPDTKVMMCVGRSFFPNHNDVKLTGKSRQGVGEGGSLITTCPYCPCGSRYSDMMGSTPEISNLS